jgi:predicted RNase H-like HicB family nuclease
MKRLTFTEQIIREGDAIVAYCPELDVSSVGNSESEARAHLQTALRLFLEEAAHLGTLKDILLEAGYHISDPELLTPTIRIEQRAITLSEELVQCLA